MLLSLIYSMFIHLYHHLFHVVKCDSVGALQNKVQLNPDHDPSLYGLDTPTSGGEIKLQIHSGGDRRITRLVAVVMKCPSAWL